MRIRIVILAIIALSVFFFFSMYAPVIYKHFKTTHSLTSNEMNISAFGIAIVWMVLLAAFVAPVFIELTREK